MSQAVADRPVIATHSRWPSLVIVLIVLAAFGPYVAGGVRTEQLAVYLVGGVMALLMVWWTKPRQAVVVVTLLWLTIPFIGAISWLTVPAYRSSGAVANLDALLLPVGVVIITVVCAHYGDRARLLRAVSATFVAGMTANSLLIFAQLFGAEASLFRRWLPAGDEYVALRADTLGRYTGILNQPALAGTMYGLALVVAIHLLRRHGVALTGVLITLTLAGLVTQSKALLFIGLPVAAISLVASVGRRSLVGLIYALGAGGLLWWKREDIYYWLVEQAPEWNGSDRLASLLFASDLAVGTVTGNRYGEAAAVTPIFERVLKESPLGGFGLSGIPTAVDSQWVAVLTIAGVIGVVALAGVLIAVWLGVSASRRSVGASESILAFGFLAILSAASFGFPVLTGNRLAVVVWVILTLLMLAPVKPGQRAVQRSRPGVVALAR